MAAASSSSSGASAPRRPLSDLDRDELLTKCKGLLQIAQKAKAAKDGKQAPLSNFHFLLRLVWFDQVFVRFWFL